MIRRRVLLGILLAALFAVGWWAGRGRAAGGPYAPLDLFVEVLHTVQANYVDEIEVRPLVEGGLHGMLQGLDPWSRYLDPRAFADYRAVSEGVFDGIGATLDARDGWPVVIAPIEGSPAWDAGLRPGDAIVKVDGRGTFGMTLEDVSAKLRGSAGTSVVVTIGREGENEEREVTLMRRRVTVRPVPDAFVIAPGIGYLRLAHFSDGAAAAVSASVDSLRSRGARSLVFDLRGDPGGSVAEAVAIAGRFLPRGALITTTAGRAPGADQRLIAGHAAPELEWPIAVLVDEGSASASEIVAGAWQDHDRALVVGARTFGKGVVQTVYPLRGRAGAITITTADYLTPTGRSLQRPRAGADAEEEEAEDAPADSLPAPRFRTDGGRVVTGGGGVVPDVEVAADSSASAAAPVRRTGDDAREALRRDPVVQRAVRALEHASGARGVFAAAGVATPSTPRAKPGPGRR